MLTKFFPRIICIFTEKLTSAQLFPPSGDWFFCNSIHHLTGCVQLQCFAILTRYFPDFWHAG